mmetsp:Transcript_13438/g.18985  ORF Transcript_13438/g.18985 Transcript_13438/m.18985 type:complete len:129 (-) Transcript_13438:79-465(-)
MQYALREIQHQDPNDALKFMRKHRRQIKRQEERSQRARKRLFFFTCVTIAWSVLVIRRSRSLKSAQQQNLRHQTKETNISIPSLSPMHSAGSVLQNIERNFTTLPSVLQNGTLMAYTEIAFIGNKTFD